MTSADARAKKLNDRVERYLNMFQSDDPEQVEQALDKLELVDMTLDCLTATGCGRIVNKMSKDELIGDRVGELVLKWRAIASAESDAKKKQVVAQQYNIKMETPIVEDVKDVKIAKDVKPVINKPKKRPLPDDINDFEKALLGVDDVYKKNSKKRPTSNVPDAEDIQKELLQDLSQGTSTSNHSTLNNYKAHVSAAQSSSTTNNDDTFDFSTIKRKERTKVYAGRRKANSGLTEVPSLLQICQRFMMEHIDQLDELGDVPFNLLECVFERCTINQLDRISEKNPHLHKDLNKLWEQHVKKTFPNKGLEKKDHTWYGAYKRLCHEREQKLKSISAKIHASNQAAAPTSRTTLMTDVINPMRMQKRQMRHGFVPSTVAVADAHQVSQARRQIFHTGSKAALLKLPNASATKGSILAKNSRSSSSSSSKPAPVGPKKGALMTKTLQMIKRQRR